MLNFANNNAFIWLLLLPIVAFSYLLIQKRNRVTIQKIGAPALVNQLMNGYDAAKQKQKIVLLIVGLLLLIIALAGPQISGALEQKTVGDREVVLALDLSNSMNATDVQPTRLDKAKLLIKKIIESGNNDRYGLIVFAGNAYISVPITPDATAILMNLEATNTQSIPTQGTDIGKALSGAYSMFDTKKNNSKIVALITDGENHEDGLEDIITNFKQDNIGIITIGVGTEKGSTIINPANNQEITGEDNKPVVSALNTKVLEQINKATKGDLIVLQNLNDALLDFKNALQQFENNSSNMGSKASYKQLYSWFLIPAICCFIFYFLPTSRTSKK